LVWRVNCGVRSVSSRRPSLRRASIFASFRPQLACRNSKAALTWGASARAAGGVSQAAAKAHAVSKGAAERRGMQDSLSGAEGD